eukprot:12151959-Ditylum_brightwellii.AAC.1
MCDEPYTQYSDTAIYELLRNKSKKKARARFVNTSVKPVLHSVLLDTGYKTNVAKIISDAIDFFHLHTKKSCIWNETHHQASCPVPNCTFEAGTLNNLFSVLPKFKSCPNHVNLRLTTSTGMMQKNANTKEDLFSSKKTKMRVPVFMQTLQDNFIKSLGKRGSPQTTMAMFLKSAEASMKKEESDE